MIKNIWFGMILGIANVIPGVSAGTMAVILNIYDKLLNAISLDKEKLKKNIYFLGTIGIGGVLGILLFSNAIKYLYDHYTMPTNYFFIGIIVGSIPMVIKNIKQGKQQRAAISLPFIAAFLLMVIMSVFSFSDKGQTVVSELSFVVFIWLVVVAAISAFTMIIPGISGSFIMLILGAYETVINAVSTLNILLLIPVAIGCLGGLVVGTKIVKILLKKYEKSTYAAILGLVIGSVFSLYPGFTFNAAGMFSIVVAGVGLFISYYFSK